jgi:hypothetical protein
MSNKTKTSSLFIYLFLQKHILLPKKDTGTQIFVAEIIIQIHTRSTVIYFFFYTKHQPKMELDNLSSKRFKMLLVILRELKISMDLETHWDFEQKWPHCCYSIATF